MGTLAASVIEWAGLTNRVAWYPAKWRRFSRPDWPTIDRYARSSSINVLLNWRNEGPVFDGDYYAFEQEVLRPMGVRSFDAWQLSEKTRQKLTWWQLCERVTRHWDANFALSLASPDFIRRPEGRIDLFVGASTTNKMLGAKFWETIVEWILNETDFGVGIHNGVEEAEERVGLALQSRFCSESRCVHFQPLTNMASVTSIMQAASAAVTLDSFPAHLCGLLGIPCVTCFVVTDHRIWSHGKSQKTIGDPPLNCPDWKHEAGNCRQYYGKCSASCISESRVSPRLVIAALKELLGSDGNLHKIVS